MRKSGIRAAVACAAALAIGPAVASAAVYPGNGATGFGGAVGTGSLAVTDTPSSMTMTLNRGSGQMNDILVVYLDTQPGGFLDNLTLGDNADDGRTAISGTNNGNPSKTLANLPFGADYAMSIENGFIGVFQLNSGGNGSLTYLFGQAQSGNNSDASYSITMSAAQMAQIGLTAGSGQTFGFVGTYTSGSAYRSNESIGSSVTVPGDGAGNAGFSNPVTFQEGLSYTLMQVPEPASVGLAGMGLVGLAGRRRRK